LKRLFGIVALAIVGAMAFAGCGNQFKQNYYRPASFGENGQCYYMQTQAEAEMLIREGLCQPTWRPAPAPWSWQTRYISYYESPEYRDYYVPASNRKIYAVYTRDFSTTWAKDIKVAEKSAVYVDNKGKKVDGTTVPRGQFGGGVRSKGGQGIRGDNGKSAKKTADKYYKQESQKTGQKTSSGGGYKAGSNNSNTPKWSSGKSSTKSSGGGIRSSRR
jgi:hypothetical protein